jgi:hypothetical protein
MADTISKADYPVVGVSKNAAEYYCAWLLALERQTIVMRKGQMGPDGKKIQEKITITTGQGYGYYRIPLALEWDYVLKQENIKQRHCYCKNSKLCWIRRFGSLRL